MNSIHDIPVHTEFAADRSATSMVDAIVHEIRQRMDVYLDRGETGAIDIKSLPLSSDDYARLERKLGRGEVSAVARLSGDTEVFETAFAGVWWVRHKNLDDRIIAEHIEVGSIPDILCSHEADMRQARERLGKL